MAAEIVAAIARTIGRRVDGCAEVRGLAIPRAFAKLLFSPLSDFYCRFWPLWPSSGLLSFCGGFLIARIAMRHRLCWQSRSNVALVQ